MKKITEYTFIPRELNEVSLRAGSRIMAVIGLRDRVAILVEEDEGETTIIRENIRVVVAGGQLPADEVLTFIGAFQLTRAESEIGLLYWTSRVPQDNPPEPGNDLMERLMAEYRRLQEGKSV